MSDPRPELIEAATDFYRRGWMLGTSGNISARADDSTFWITASGLPKGTLTESDFVRIDAATGEPAGDDGNEASPSAETTIHRVLYQALGDAAGAVLHVHTVSANLFARMHRSRPARLPKLEMIKGLGIWEDRDDDLLVPIFPNHYDVPQIARDVEAALTEQVPEVPGFLIMDHGITAWGVDVQAARNHIELFEYLFDFSVRAFPLRLGD